MIIDRTHAGWAGFVAAGTVLSTLAYLANYHPDALPFHIPLPDWAGPVPPVRANVGGTPLGLFFGTLALLIFLFAALLGFRRRRPSLPIGRMQTWLKAHIWFTIFTIPLVLFHSGFTGGGPMTQLLLVLYAIVMASGFYGLALQRFLPSIMRRYLQEEVIYEQIPFVSAQLHMQALAIREELATPPVTVAAQEHAMVAGHGDHAEGTDAPAPVIVNTPVTPASVVSFVDSNVIPFVSVDAWMWQYQDTFKAEARHKEREAG